MLYMVNQISLIKIALTKVNNTAISLRVIRLVKTNGLLNCEKRVIYKLQKEPKISHNGQATKSTRGMPWHREPMKDVTNCDKLRGAVSRRYIRRFPNGAIQSE